MLIILFCNKIGGAAMLVGKNQVQVAVVIGFVSLVLNLMVG